MYSAYPRSISWSWSSASVEFRAGSGFPRPAGLMPWLNSGTVPFQSWGTSITYVAPLFSAPVTWSNPVAAVAT